MDTYEQGREKDRSNAEIIGQKRQEKALREFKQVLENLIFLLRSASGMETVYMYWINRSREQFVMETKSTSLSNVMFQDRLGFHDHFLDQYKDISEPVAIELGPDLPVEALGHYYNEVPIKYVTLLPFTNNGETVAVTVLESSDHIFTDDKSEVIYSYINALRNVLNTYLEISDLYERQEEWIDYEQNLSVLGTKDHRAELIVKMLNLMGPFLHNGGASFIAPGMGTWCNLLNSENAQQAAPVGLTMEQRSLAREAAQKGKPEFAIHFNSNPKRLSPREMYTEGATLAIPLVMDEHRQGVVLAYDKNPLVFKESTKHKLINLVRITGLKILANEPNLEAHENMLTNDFEAFIPDIWERVVDCELKRKQKNLTDHHFWIGFLTLSELPTIRTKLRLEDLLQMQKDLVAAFNPGRFGVSGIIGFYSDYVYSFLIQSKDKQAVEDWIKSVKQELSEPFKLTNGKEIETGIETGYTALDKDATDSYEVISRAKNALSQTMNSNQSYSRPNQNG